MIRESPERDCLILALRLLAEDEDTFSPEVREVMDRWRPRCLEAFNCELPAEAAQAGVLNRE